MKKFSVVSFKKDNTVEAVPSAWITDDKISCHWPKKYPKNFKSIIQCSDSVPGGDWILYAVDVIKSYDTFERASKKAESYRFRSDAETSEGELHVRMKAKPGPSHQTLQPPVGTLHLGISDDQATSQDVSSRLSTLTTDQPLTTSNESYPVANEFPESTFGALNTTGDSTESETYFAAAPVLDLASKTDVQDLQAKLTNFQLVTLEKLAELKQDVAGISTLLSSVLASQNAAVPQPASTVFNLLPIKTVDGFKELELELKNKASYDNLVSMFARIGGPTHTQNVYNILKSTFSKSVVVNFRLTDTSGKVALKNTILVKAIRDAVHHSHRLGNLPEDNKLNTDIGRWFRNQGYCQNEKLSPNTKKHQATSHPSVRPSGNDSSSEEDN